MNIVIVSDRDTAEQLEKDCLATGIVSKVRRFDQVNTALIYMINENTDGLLLDFDVFPIDMQNEIITQDLIKYRQKMKNTDMIAIASTEDHALRTYVLGGAGYIMKPWSFNELQQALQRMARRRQKRRVYIRTFGHFDVFIDQTPIYFHNLKAKELLALLVDKRGTVTMEMAVNFLWENHRYDDNVKQLYRKAVNYLRSIMREYDLDFFVANRSSCYIKMAEVTCDYYLLLEGDERAIAEYNGQYMFEYAWAEISAVQMKKYIHYWRSKKVNEG